MLMMTEAQIEKCVAFGEKIDGMIKDANVEGECRFCRYSYAWFTFLPAHKTEMIDQVKSLFGAKIPKVVVHPNPVDPENSVQINAYLEGAL